MTRGHNNGSGSNTDFRVSETSEREGGERGMWSKRRDEGMERGKRETKN